MVSLAIWILSTLFVIWVWVMAGSFILWILTSVISWLYAVHDRWDREYAQKRIDRQRRTQGYS